MKYFFYFNKVWRKTMERNERTGFSAFVYEFLIVTVASFLPFIETPAMAEDQLRFDPLPVSDGVKLEAGTFTPPNPEAFILPQEQYCALLIQDWGWESCSGVDNIVFFPTSSTDNTVIFPPNRDGWVKMNDWTEEKAAELVEEIEASLKLSAVRQSKNTGEDMQFLGWRVQPTLDRDSAVMFYATDWSFDGVMTSNISATAFDRRGYIKMGMVPRRQDLGSSEIKALILDNLHAYHSNPGESYASFQAGDKVAAAGALGLLSAFFGVKYGKAVAGGILAGLLVLGKKLIFVVPLAIIGGLSAFWRRLTGRGKSDPPAT